MWRRRGRDEWRRRGWGGKICCTCHIELDGTPHTVHGSAANVHSEPAVTSDDGAIVCAVANSVERRPDEQVEGACLLRGALPHRYDVAIKQVPARLLNVSALRCVVARELEEIRPPEEAEGDLGGVVRDAVGATSASIGGRRIGVHTVDRRAVGVEVDEEELKAHEGSRDADAMPFTNALHAGPGGRGGIHDAHPGVCPCHVD